MRGLKPPLPQPLPPPLPSSLLVCVAASRVASTSASDDPVCLNVLQAWKVFSDAVELQKQQSAADLERAMANERKRAAHELQRAIAAEEHRLSLQSQMAISKAARYALSMCDRLIVRGVRWVDSGSGCGGQALWVNCWVTHRWGGARALHDVGTVCAVYACGDRQLCAVRAGVWCRQVCCASRCAELLRFWDQPRGVKVEWCAFA